MKRRKMNKERDMARAGNKRRNIKGKTRQREIK
jgi:hypothetical protein